MWIPLAVEHAFACEPDRTPRILLFPEAGQQLPANGRIVVSTTTDTDPPPWTSVPGVQTYRNPDCYASDGGPAWRIEVGVSENIVVRARYADQRRSTPPGMRAPRPSVSTWKAARRLRVNPNRR